MSFRTKIFKITIVHQNEPLGARLFKIELQLPIIQLISGARELGMLIFSVPYLVIKTTRNAWNVSASVLP